MDWLKETYEAIKEEKGFRKLYFLIWIPIIAALLANALIAICLIIALVTGNLISPSEPPRTYDFDGGLNECTGATRDGRC